MAESAEIGSVLEVQLRRQQALLLQPGQEGREPETLLQLAMVREPTEPGSVMALASMLMKPMARERLDARHSPVTHKQHTVVARSTIADARQAIVVAAADAGLVSGANGDGAGGGRLEYLCANEPVEERLDHLVAPGYRKQALPRRYLVDSVGIVEVAS